MEGTVCRLIIGLGNPGPEYENTRHNAGFEVVNRFLAKHAKSFSPRKTHCGRAWQGTFAASKLILMEPLTFMNLSGEAVAPLMRGEGLRPEEIMVIYDDIDLPVGRMRIRGEGGNAGHNGMKSVIEHVGTEKFPRLRIGIGEDDPESKRRPDYVLSKFEGANKEAWEQILDKAVEALEMMLRRGMGCAMNMYNPVDCRPGNHDTENQKKNTPQQEVES